MYFAVRSARQDDSVGVDRSIGAVAGRLPQAAAAASADASANRKSGSGANGAARTSPSAASALFGGAHLRRGADADSTLLERLNLFFF